MFKKHIEFIEIKHIPTPGDEHILIFIVKCMLSYFGIYLHNKKLISYLLDNNIKITDLTWSVDAEKNFLNAFGGYIDRLNPKEKLIFFTKLKPRSINRGF